MFSAVAGVFFVDRGKLSSKTYPEAGMMTIAASLTAEVDLGKDFCRAVTWISDDNRGARPKNRVALPLLGRVRVGQALADSGRSSDPAAICVRGFCERQQSEGQHQRRRKICRL